MDAVLLGSSQLVSCGYSICLCCHDAKVPVDQHYHYDYLLRHVKDAKRVADVVDGGGGDKDIGTKDGIEALEHQRHHGDDAFCHRDSCLSATAADIEHYLSVKKWIKDAHKYHQGQDKPHSVQALFDGELTYYEAKDRIYRHDDKGRKGIFSEGYCDKDVNNAKKQLSQRMKVIHPVGSLLQVLKFIQFANVFFYLGHILPLAGRIFKLQSLRISCS